jgi:hypothetical protein
LAWGWELRGQHLSREKKKSWQAVRGIWLSAAYFYGPSAILIVGPAMSFSVLSGDRTAVGKRALGRESPEGFVPIWTVLKWGRLMKGDSDGAVRANPANLVTAMSFASRVDAGSVSAERNGVSCYVKSDYNRVLLHDYSPFLSFSNFWPR